MMWPFNKTPEKRQSRGAFYDLVLRQIEAQASGTAANVSSTAAVEAASGALSRAFASAEVDGPSWVQDAVTPSVLAQVGRDLIRRGASMHIIRSGRGGRINLIVADSWHFEGHDDPDSWTVRATSYGPSTSSTRNIPAHGVVFVRWGSEPGQPYTGTGPLSWASTTARLQSETERSLADEAGGPIANLIAFPQDPGDEDDDENTLARIQSAIGSARGRAMLLETLAGGLGEGMIAAPHKDWIANRLGPNPPDAMATIRKDTFAAVLAACGCSPALFDDSDGTSKREALRQWHLGTVRPLARMLETELSAKLETPVKLAFDSYPMDMVSRAQVVDKLVKAGVPMAEAMATVGLS